MNLRVPAPHKWVRCPDCSCNIVTNGFGAPSCPACVKRLMEMPITKLPVTEEDADDRAARLLNQRGIDYLKRPDGNMRRGAHHSGTYVEEEA